MSRKRTAERDTDTACSPPDLRRANGQFDQGTTAGSESRFQPGESGNPGGRPKSLGANIRSKVGEDGEALIAQLLKLAHGRGTAPVRIQAIRELLDRGWGRPTQFVESHEHNTWTVDVAGARERLAARLAEIARPEKYATPEELQLIRDIHLRWEQRMTAADNAKKP